MPNRTPRNATTTSRGLGWDHQQHRERLLIRHVDGTRCWWCNEKMWREPRRNPDGRALRADHSKPRSVNGIAGNHADRLLHASCNESRGDGSRDDSRPALVATSHPHEAGLGERIYFDWPD